MDRRVPIGRQLDIVIFGRAGMFRRVVVVGIVRVGRGGAAARLEDVEAFEAEVDGVGRVGGGQLLLLGGVFGWFVFGLGGRR